MTTKKGVFGGIPSTRVHVPKMLAVASSTAWANTITHKSHKIAKNTILIIIASLMLIIVGITIFAFIATPEYLVKREIENIARDYYENYYYPSIPNPSGLDYYAERGFARVTLRQLMLYDNRKHYASMEYLSTYCNLDQTQIKIYPEKPFERKNYRVDYTYSCKF